MKVTILTRFPRVDVAAWKLSLAAGLLARGDELSVVYTRSAFADQLREGVREFGTGIVARYRKARAAAPEAEAAPVETLSAWAARHGVRVATFRSIGEPAVEGALRALAPDVVVLAGADIVPPELVGCAREGFVNPHYGLLPKYRGMNVAEWSVFHDDPVAVTVHRVDAGIDTGDILASEYVLVEAGDTLETIRAKQQRLAAALLLSTVAAIRDGTVTATPQRPEDGRQYYRMHPRLRAAVEAKLAAGTYSWLGRVPEPADVAGRGTASR